MTEEFLVPLVAGGSAGLFVDITLFPLDTIKTRIQSSQGFLKTGGFHGIYSGIGSAAMGSVPAAATFFCTYEITKSLADSCLPNIPTPYVHVVAASLGELVSNVVRVPFEVVKQRAQAYRNMTSLRALTYSLQQEGYKGLYRGYWNTVFREVGNDRTTNETVPFAFIQYPLWEFLKKSWSRHQSHPVHAWQSAICGALAGAVAGGLTTPFDVAKTRVMLAKKDCPTTKVNPFAVLFMIGSQEGLPREGKFRWHPEIRYLFSNNRGRGIVPRALGIGIGGAIFLGIYDKSRTMLNHILQE